MVFLLLGIALSSCNSAGADFHNKAIRKGVESSVILEWDGPRGWTPYASGVVIEHNGSPAILTAHHAAGYDPDLRACSIFNRELCVELGPDFLMNSDESPDDDWAIYPLEEIPGYMAEAKIDCSDPKIGEPVWSIGNPHGQSMVTHGTVSWRYEDIDLDEPLWTIDGFGFPGSSGGGVWTEKGHLMGIVIAGPLWPRVGDLDMFMEDIPIVLPMGNVDLVCD